MTLVVEQFDNFCFCKITHLLHNKPTLEPTFNDLNFEDVSQIGLLIIQIYK